jgi:uncharacterized protein (UPF0332 family)
MEKLELVKLQLEKAEERLEAAKYLLEGEYYEDAVSRAYYSMYYATRAILTLKNIEPKTHEGLLSKFGLHVIRESDVEEYYGKALKFAKEEREKSDYDAAVEISEEEAELLIDDAEKFLERIRRAIREMGEMK